MEEFKVLILHFVIKHLLEKNCLIVLRPMALMSVSVPINCYDGNPKYDIAEIISPAGEQEYQELLDRIEHTRNLIFIHRIIHWFKPIPNPKIRLKSRERQLFVSLIRMFHEESVWPEIKSVISHYILERRGRQRDTLHAYLYGLIRKLNKRK